LDANVRNAIVGERSLPEGCFLPNPRKRHSPLVLKTSPDRRKGRDAEESASETIPHRERAEALMNAQESNSIKFRTRSLVQRGHAGSSQSMLFAPMPFAGNTSSWETCAWIARGGCANVCAPQSRSLSLSLSHAFP